MKGYNVRLQCHFPIYFLFTIDHLITQTKDPKEIAKLIANEPKQKYNNPRIPSAYKSGRVVVITQSEKPVLLARSGNNEVKEFPVKQIGEKELIDTNGAGDAFTGGFLAM